MPSLQEIIAAPKRSGSIEFFIETRNAETVVSRMPVTKGIVNPFGTVQAGAMIWLADVTATILALENVTLGPNGEGFPLAVDLHTTLLSNQKDGEIRAEARFVRKGTRVIVIRTRITGNKAKLLAELTSTHVAAAT